MSVEPVSPDAAALAAFWEACKRARPDLKLGNDYRTRLIGGSADMNNIILSLIATGQKVGTFPLPWQLEKMGESIPKPGDCTIQVDFHGTPKLVVRTTSIETIAFKNITGEHTAIDGPTVRDLAVWRGIHIPYYTGVLTKLGLVFSEDMPTCVERFELIYKP